MAVQIEFHTGLGDKPGHACRLLRKAVKAGQRVVVTGALSELRPLDALLWTFAVGEFLPHHLGPPEREQGSRRDFTPIWLVADPHAGTMAAAQASVQVHLGPSAVEPLTAAARLIELVGVAPGEVQAGRLRWQHHTAAGKAPVHHRF